MNSDELKLHDIVALMDALPREGLRRGQIGTIIDIYEPGVYEVEFADNQGQTYAGLTLRASQLLALHSEPAVAS